MDSQEMQQQFRQLMQQWFIRYNPLYFFSALCVLGGVYLVSFGLEDLLWTRGQLALSGIVQCYEFLLIGAAALLYRRMSLTRPAVILGLIELGFLFDSTFRAEVFTTVDFSGSTLSIIWLSLLFVKLNALLRAFRLKVSAPDFVLPLAAASASAIIPQLIDRHYVHADAIHIGASFFGVVLIAVLVWRKPAIRSSVMLSEWGQVVLQRTLNTFRILVGLFYFLHLFTWLYLFTLDISALHLLALLLVLPLVTKQRDVVWIVCAIVLAFCFRQPSCFAPMAAVVGLVFIFKAVQLREARFYIGAVLAFYLSIWTLGWHTLPFPPLNVWLSLVAALVLLLMAWLLKLPSALTPLAAGAYPLVKVFSTLNSVQKGILFLALGFAALLFGVGINWRQSSRQ